jgi:replicative DNA helicase
MNQSSDKSLDQSRIQNIMKEIDLEKPLTGLPTGFTDLNRLLNGLKDGDLIVVGGKSVGKTSFVLNICAHVAITTDTCVSYFSLATNKERIINRLIAAEGNVDLRRLEQKALTSDDWGRFSMSLASLSNANMHIFDDAILRVDNIEENITVLQEEYPDAKHLIAVDYLSLIDAEGQQNRYEQTDFIVKKLKIMARTLNCPIILVVNLSRNYDRRVENTKSDSRPRLSDLRDSGTIEEDADVVMFLHEDKQNIFNEYDLDAYKRVEQETSEYNSRIIEIIIDKHRNGPIGTVQLVHVKNYSKFVNYSPTLDEE